MSKLLIPVAGFEIAERMEHVFDLAFGLSIISLGVGFFLFLFVGAAVYHRYIYHELPASKLAPTFFVGIAPTAIIAVVLFKLHHLIAHAQPLGLSIDAVGGVLKLAILMNWGLAVWWFAMALALMFVYLRTVRIPYALSWWAFTFPTGALAVATGVAWRVTDFAFIWGIYVFVTGFLLVIWLLVALRTAQGMITGKVFQPAH